MLSKRLAWLSVIVVLANCSTSTEPTFDPHSFVGNWTLSIDSTSDCWPSTTFYFTINGEDADGYSATAPAMNILSHWGFSADDSDHYFLSGHLNLKELTFMLGFWLQAPTIGFEFSGTIENPQLLDGRIDAKSEPTCMAEAVALQG